MLYQWQQANTNGWQDALLSTLMSFDDHYPVNIDLYWKLAYLLDDDKQQELYLRQHHLPLSNEIAVRWLAGSGEQANRAISRLKGKVLPERLVELMAMQPSLWSRLVEACQQLPYFPEGMEKELMRQTKASELIPSRQIACLFRHAEPHKDWNKWLLLATQDQRRTFFHALAANPNLSVKRWLLKTTLLELTKTATASPFELDPLLPDLMSVVMSSGPLPGISTMVQLGLAHSDKRIRDHSLSLLCDMPKDYLAPLAKIMLNRWVVEYGANGENLYRIEKLQQAYPDLLNFDHLVQMMAPADAMNLL
ncbi:hypothetical protein CS022_02955 [Veronia nyctiphanis]|uniref:Uncharacterized protein n=1 Tax=Veronia nyctiphanis TaxID=1278244 RepID=A0A4V1LTA8_9GAMM|nr:hypothetical protein [Veronia nyctiphanis]RXJ74548.1 hypothetical protein CS022_02955 [Veronia nyctiphanis]